MRYLYGDSSPFQLQYDFLATLGDFVAAGSRAVGAERALAAVRARHAAARADRELGVANLGAFHRGMADGIAKAAAQARDDASRELAKKTDAYAERLYEDARAASAEATARDEEHEQLEATQRREEARRAVETFLLVGRLPTLDAKIFLDLTQGENVVHALFFNPLGVVTSFALDARRAPAWRKERRVADFKRGITVQVGLKKSLFKREMQPEMAQLDELVVGGFELASDAAELRLRKKVDAKDSLVFKLRRDGAGVSGELSRDGEESPLEPGDAIELEKLWSALRAAAGELLTNRERVLAVEIDKTDLFAGDTTRFFTRVVKLFAPLVAEITKHSPNPAELSLKVEDDAGRREEIYLKKQDLRDKLAPLDAEGRAVFAPLLGDAPIEEHRGTLPSIDILLETTDNS